jgi:type IV pilus biogenesis protein PilP
MFVFGFVLLIIGVIAWLYIDHTPSVPLQKPIITKIPSPSSTPLSLVTPSGTPLNTTALPVNVNVDAYVKLQNLKQYTRQKIAQDATLTPAVRQQYLNGLAFLDQAAKNPPSVDDQLDQLIELNKKLRTFTLKNQILDQERKLVDSNFAITKTQMETAKLVGERQPGTEFQSQKSSGLPNESGFRLMMIYGVEGKLQAAININGAAYTVKEGDALLDNLYTVTSLTPSSITVFSKADNKTQTYSIKSE